MELTDQSINKHRRPLGGMFFLAAFFWFIGSFFVTFENGPFEALISYIFSAVLLLMGAYSIASKQVGQDWTNKQSALFSLGFFILFSWIFFLRIQFFPTSEFKFDTAGNLLFSALPALIPYLFIYQIFRSNLGYKLTFVYVFIVLLATVLVY